VEHPHCTTTIREPWNKGKLVGQKAPFKLKELWAIRVRLQLASRHRDLALFNLAIDSKLRACDLVKLRVRDLCQSYRSPGYGIHELAAALIHIRNPNSKLVAGFRSPNTPAASNAVMPCKNAHSATAASGAFSSP
jgi:hypothetical protein